MKLKTFLYRFSNPIKFDGFVRSTETPSLLMGEERVSPVRSLGVLKSVNTW
jgi:hypothetical protein